MEEGTINEESRLIKSRDDILVEVASESKLKELYRKGIYWAGGNFGAHFDENSRWRYFFEGVDFGLNKIWVSVFSVFIVVDTARFLFYPTYRYGTTLNQIWGGIADNQMTFTTNWGSDIVSEPMYSFMPALMGGMILIGGPAASMLWNYCRKTDNPENQNRLISETSEDLHDLEEAEGNEDSFFDACAQALNTVLRQEKYTVKLLRVLCRDYARSIDKVCDRDSAGTGNWIGKFFNNHAEYTKYLENIEYTAEEKPGLVIRGRLDLDGKIICEQLKVELHVVVESKSHDENLIEKHIYLGDIGFSESEQNNEKIIHIRMRGLNFVPMLGQSVSNVQETALNVFPAPSREHRNRSERVARPKTVGGIYGDYDNWRKGKKNRSVWGLDILYVSFLLYVYYTYGRLVELWVIKSMGLDAYRKAKAECESRNMSFCVLPDYGNEECVVVCPDEWPFIADKDRFTNDDALRAFLSAPQDPELILAKIDDVLRAKPALQVIDLSGQNLLRWSRPQLRMLLEKVSAKLSSLQTFNISAPVLNPNFPNDGRLQDVREFLGNVTTQKFSMKNQGVGQPGIETLWPTAKKSTVLELSGNQMTAMPGPLNETGITHFDVDQNNLGDTGFIDLANGSEGSALVEVNVGGNGITGKGLETASESFPRNSVKTLKASNNNFQTADMGYVGKNIKASKVEVVDFSGDQLDDQQVNAFTSNAKNSSMTSVSLAYNNMSGMGMIYAVRNARNSSITHFNFAGNIITDDAIKGSVTYLSETSICHLGLSQTKISANGVKLLIDSGRIRSLDLSRNPIGVQVVNLLVQNKTVLENLDLSFTGLTDEAGVRFSTALPASVLKSLILRGNLLQDAATIAFAKALPNSGLIVFDVSLNAIGDAGMSVLAQFLPQTVLELLSVAGNRMTDVSGVPLARSMVTYTPHSEEIGNKDVDRDEIREVREAHPNTRLRELDISDNPTANSTVRAFNRVLPNTNITTFGSNASQSFFASPPAARIGNSNSNMIRNASSLMIGAYLMPNLFLCVFIICLIYRYTRSQEGTPSCKK